MVIKNKDGTTYLLRGPNPLLEKQADWDKKSVKLINLGVQSETISPIEEVKSNIVNIRDELNLIDNPKTKAVRASDFIKELTD